MNLQISHSITALAMTSLLWICPTCASAQVPVKDNAPEPLAAKSVNDPVAALRSMKVIYVKSHSLLVGVSVIEEKLQKRPEFSQMGLAISRDIDAADVILEVHHDILTKYVYSAIDKRTNMLLASGKLSSLGGTVAGKVAKKFLKQVMQARATAPRS